MANSETLRDDVAGAMTGGRVGELMRTRDWSATPLGPMEQWPQSLRTMVGTILGSRFPMLIWWGPDLVKLYNDPYAEIISEKHPHALGRLGREVWPEIWPIIGPMLDGVLERGEATWSEDLMLPLERRGFAEECYFTFSYSPIRDESGAIAGVFTAVTETTAQVIGQRRLHTLRDLASATASAGSVNAACMRASAVMAGHREDLPFTLLYLLDAEGLEARRVALTGIDATHPAAPAVIAIEAPDAPWPFAEVLRRNGMVEQHEVAELAIGSHDFPVREVAVLPLGRPHLERPYGFLVAGVSARRPFDAEYVSFVELVADQVTSAIADAGALEEKHRRAEALAELDRARAVLFSEQRRSLFELFVQAPAPVCVLRGPDLVFEMANPAYEEVFGRPGLAGRKFLEALPELRGQGLDDRLRMVQESGETMVSTELPVSIHPPGEAGPQQTYWNVVYAPLGAGDDGQRRVMVFAYDVSEQVLARHAAEASSRAKDEFLAMLGHELRNPLSPILTALEVMQLRGDVHHAQERRIIDRQVRHLVSLIDDLLDVSRITQGKLQIRPVPLELDHVLTQAIEMASPLFEQRRHHLRVTLVPGVRVIGEERRLAQVFSNLLNNAAKYTEPGGNISLDARVEDEEVIVSVVDDGAGITPDLMPHLFEPFIQGPTGSDRARGGLGLGLTIVRSLVRLHGGSVVAHSGGPGRGAEFTVRLPVFARASAGGSSDLELVDAQHSGGGRRVLVVDDNLDAAEVLVQALVLMGYTAEARHDGPAAITRVEEQPPAAVLLDIGLPVMDGYEVARRIRALPVGANMQIIAVTGYGQARDRENALAAGFDEHMVKPIRIEALLEVLERLHLPASG